MLLVGSIDSALTNNENAADAWEPLVEKLKIFSTIVDGIAEVRDFFWETSPLIRS